MRRRAPAARKNPHPNGCGFNTHGLDSHRSSFSFAGQGHFASANMISGTSGDAPKPIVDLRRGAREIALDDTLCFDITCSYPLMVSPPLRGSNPYPCGSLTYRILHTYFMTGKSLCQPRGGENFADQPRAIHQRSRSTSACGSWTVDSYTPPFDWMVRRLPSFPALQVTSTRVSPISRQ